MAGTIGQSSSINNSTYSVIMHYGKVMGMEDSLEFHTHTHTHPSFAHRGVLFTHRILFPGPARRQELPGSRRREKEAVCSALGRGIGDKEVS